MVAKTLGAIEGVERRFCAELGECNEVLRVSGIALSKFHDIDAARGIAVMSGFGDV